MKINLYRLEVKFISLAMVIIIASSILISYYLYTTEAHNHIAEVEKRARLFSESTAISFVNTLLYEEIGLVEEGGLLENQIFDIVKNRETGIIDIVVLNPKGQPIAANDFSWYDRPPNDSLIVSLVETREARMSHNIRDDKKVLEVVTPLKIHGKGFGTLVTYYSLEKEYRYLATWRNQLIFMSIIYLLGGVGVAFIVARILATPIKRLASEMVNVSDPYYKSKIISNRRDEIGLVEQGFLNMMARLEKADIDKVKSQQTLAQAEKLAAMGTLVAGLAHEVNNPLAGAMNALRRISTNPEDIEQTKHYALLMKKALHRIEKLVQGLLHFSKRKEFVMHPLDMNKIISQSVELLTYKLKEKNINFSLSLSTDLPKTMGDKEMMGQVIDNLLLNGIDAVKEKGTIQIESFVEDKSVIIEVVDDGIGINPSDMKKIFDPFYTTKKTGEGTGLGLSVCKNIVESHFGIISVQNGMDRGTVIRVELPAEHQSSV